jgi:hypothetical protein
MNCTECGSQTDVSAPGAGTAAAKHHRDMMWMLWPDHPRQRDNHPTATAGAILPGGPVFRPAAESGRFSYLPDASIATGKGPNPQVPPVP